MKFTYMHTSYIHLTIH